MSRCADCGTAKNLIRIQPPELAEFYYYLCPACKEKQRAALKAMEAAQTISQQA